MKRYCAMIVVAALVMAGVSCSNKKKSREEMVTEFRSELTATDTATMLKLCDNAMEQLKQKKIDEVLASLYEYTDSTQEVKKLTAETEKVYRRRFTMFPVLEYERKYFSFQLEGCNDVKYEVVFRTAEQAGTAEPAKTAFMFNPVKIDGDWKLCVKTPADMIDMTMHE